MSSCSSLVPAFPGPLEGSDVVCGAVPPGPTVQPARTRAAASAEDTAITSLRGVMPSG